MSNDSFIAINIVIKNDKDLKLINEFPIIFYWDGESDMTNDFLNNENFTKLIYQTFNIDSYDKAYINLEYVNDENNHKEESISIQKLYPLDNENITLIFNDLKFNYIKEIFLTLYTRVLKENYKSEFEESQLIIKDLYDRIQNGITKNVSKETIVNYIREQLIEKTKLNKLNIDYLINLLEYIIRESN